MLTKPLKIKIISNKSQSNIKKYEMVAETSSKVYCSSIQLQRHQANTILIDTYTKHYSVQWYIYRM